MSDAPVSLRCLQILPRGTRMISINFGFGPPLMVETMFWSRWNLTKRWLEVEPVGCCFNHLYQLTSLGLPQKDVIFTVAEKGLPQVETSRKCFPDSTKRKSGTDEGLGTVWLVVWMDTLFLNDHIIIPLPPAPAQVGYMLINSSLRKKRYSDQDSQIFGDSQKGAILPGFKVLKNPPIWGGNSTTCYRSNPPNHLDPSGSSAVNRRGLIGWSTEHLKVWKMSCCEIGNLTGMFTYMGVSKNSGTPKSSILIRISIINHPFWGTPIFGNTHIYHKTHPKCR